MDVRRREVAANGKWKMEMKHSIPIFGTLDSRTNMIEFNHPFLLEAGKTYNLCKQANGTYRFTTLQGKVLDYAADPRLELGQDKASHRPENRREGCGNSPTRAVDG
jgi:hypothetical protein